MDHVEERLKELAPDVAVVDSIQTMYRPEMASAPGSVSQIRECTSLLMRLCKESGTAVFLVGTRDQGRGHCGPANAGAHGGCGAVFRGRPAAGVPPAAGGEEPLRLGKRAGCVQMTQEGMRVVENPSEQLLSHRAKGASGSVVFCGMEGSRPLLVDRAGAGLAHVFRDAPAHRGGRGHGPRGAAAGGAGETRGPKDL